ncbi:Uncharacterized protein Fot_20942 [Forsythia ovata]|uniref:Uncharacterized protein n=1 Tax=Forsythia ovata TaxID=205694 RepID=A0ABD1UTE8_9LAMI
MASHRTTRYMDSLLKLVRRVSEETNISLTIKSILTWLRTIARRVKPALEYTKRVFTRVTHFIAPLTKLRAHTTRIMKLPGILLTDLFAGVGIRWHFYGDGDRR